MHKKIGDYCNQDLDCADPNSQCLSSCISTNCSVNYKVCKCKINFFESVDVRNNEIVCSK